ncbi:unnamed protein product [Camellia sinensis]
MIDGFEQEKKVVVIAATHRKQDLDPALISRFDSMITFGLPDQQTRQEIAAQYAKHLAKSDLPAFAKVDVAAVAVFSAEPWTVPWTAKTILQSQEMEYATKPPSNISDIVSKFAKVCRFRSIGVFSTENPTHNHQPIIDFGNNVPSSEDSSDATEEAECDIEKIHPNPVEIQPKTTECVNMEILKSLCSGNDSSILAVTEGCQLSIWDLRMKENGGCVRRIYGSVGDIFYAVYSSSTSIAVGGADRTVIVYDPRS